MLLRPIHFLRTRSTGTKVGAGALVLAAVAVSVVLVRSANGTPTISISAGGCGTSWTAPRSGTTTFSVRNHTTTTADVVLAGRTGEVYGEIPNLGPDVTRPLQVTLEPGLYSWRCVSVNGEFSFSRSERVTGKTIPDPSPGFQPVTADDLSTAALAYRAFAASGLNTVAKDADTLSSAVRSGDRALAEKDWLHAHLDYERLGAVYNAFGDFNDEINGRADGLAGKVRSPQFQGFLRLEYGLWHRQPQVVLNSVANNLDHNIHALIKAFPSQLVLVTDVPLRAHEIIENALQFELTGDTDEGSHTNLATFRANVDGDREVLSVLRPLLASRDPQLVTTAESDLNTLATQLDAYRQKSGWWTPVESLTLAQHQQLDADADAALGALDQVPAQLEEASGDSS